LFFGFRDKFLEKCQLARLELTVHCNRVFTKVRVTKQFEMAPVIMVTVSLQMKLSSASLLDYMSRLYEMLKVDFGSMVHLPAAFPLAISIPLEARKVRLEYSHTSFHT